MNKRILDFKQKKIIKEIQFQIQLVQYQLSLAVRPQDIKKKSEFIKIIY